MLGSTYDYLCDLADSYGSPHQYTIVGIKNLNSYNKIGPLLTTQWGQGNTFNDMCPNNSPAGCVAIAMAQIMKFHQHPKSFDWTNMPNSIGTPSTQYLIRVIGITVNMDYGKTSSGSNIHYAQAAFQNAFDYSVRKENHNFADVKNEIMINKNEYPL